MRILVAIFAVGLATQANFGIFQTSNNTSVQFFTNFSGTNLSRFRAAAASTQANSADTKIFFLGDSTIEGLGAGASNQIANSISTQVAGLVSNASWQSAFFDHNWGNCQTFNSLDARFTADTNCTQIGLGGLAGGAMGSNDPHTDGFHVTPTTSFDTIDIGYDTSGNGGSFTIGYDGGAVSSTISPQASLGFQISTVTTNLGTHTIDQKNVSQSAGSFIQFIIARKSTTKQVLMMNGGIGGAKTTDFTSQANAYNYLSALITLGPHLALTENGIINDWGNGVAVATSQANITTTTNALLTNTDVILMTGVPSQTSVVAQATQVQYQTMILALARTLGVPCIDTFGKFVDWNTANANGWMADSLHPNTTGYGIIAGMVAQVLNNPNFRSQ